MRHWVIRFGSSPVWRYPSMGYAGALLLGLVSVWVTMGSPLFVLQGGLVIDTDYPNAAAAFELFIRDSWRWPLGENPAFGGVNLFFSDGAPWFALFAKGLYQITGLTLSLHWLVLLNMLLWPVMAWRLAICLHAEANIRWLVVGLLTFNLVVLVRMIGAQHIALASFWLVLWAMCAVPLVASKERAWGRWEFLLVLTVAVWSHAYVAAMVALILLVLLVASRRWWSLPLVVVCPLLLLYAIGALQVDSTPMGGAKAYAFDLAAYTKSLGWGVAGNLYDIHEVTQGDAIVYLGTGAWWLLAACVSVAVFYRCIRPVALFATPDVQYRWWALVVACSGLAIFAMAFDLRVAGDVWAGIEIPRLFSPFYESFRATGRFAAPLAFLLVVLAALWWGAWYVRLPSPIWWGWL